jgi:hypothetical protein
MLMVGKYGSQDQNKCEPMTEGSNEDCRKDEASSHVVALLQRKEALSYVIGRPEALRSQSC